MKKVRVIICIVAIVFTLIGIMLSGELDVPRFLTSAAFFAAAVGYGIVA